MPKLLWGILIFISAIAALCIIAFTVVYFAGSGIPANEKQNMVGYLNSKYDTDFSVSDISVKTSGLGGTKTLTGMAYLNANTSFKFEIWREDTAYGYYDNYLEKLWSQQAEEALAPLKSEIDGIDRSIVRTGPSKALYNTIQGSPSFSEAKQSYPSQYGYSLTLYDGSTSVSPSNLSEKDLSNVLLAVNFVNEQGSDHKELKFFFRKSGSTTEPGSYASRVELQDEDLDTIHTIDDLNKYIKVEE